LVALAVVIRTSERAGDFLADINLGVVRRGADEISEIDPECGVVYAGLVDSGYQCWKKGYHQ